MKDRTDLMKVGSSMENHLKETAEKTLKYLCVGAVIEGLNFYGLKLILSGAESNFKRIDGQIYINLESKFEIFKSFPLQIPLEHELPNLDWKESAKKVCELRLKKITDIRLTDTVPHLFITFETGEVLFISGHNDKYESWQVGVWGNSNKEEIWEVVCCPGDGIAIWAPDDIAG